MKLTASISKSMTAIIFINQIRMKIGVYRRGRMPQIASTWETDMGQNDSIDDKKPKKKRASHILYYVIYIAILVVLGAVVFIFF
jgi:RecA/RadA recombinase